MKPSKIPIKKSKEEIEFYIEYGEVFEEVLLELKYYIEDGCKDIEDEFICLCRYRFTDCEFPFYVQKNQYGQTFKRNICISTNDTVAHGRNNYFNTNDIISVDCGVTLFFDHSNLNFDAAFTTIFNKEDVEVPAYWYQAPLMALKNITSKQPKDTMQIAEIIQNTAKEHNLSQVLSLTGHGIGYELHEAPSIHNAPGPFMPIDLFEGIVFCAEPIFVNENKNISSICLSSDGWEISTTSGASSSHFETMYAVYNGQLIDLIGLSKWTL